MKPCTPAVLITKADQTFWDGCLSNITSGHEIKAHVQHRWGNATGRVHRCGPHFLCLPFLGCVKAINLPPRHEYLPWGQRPLGCTQINYRNSMKFTCLVGAVQIYHGNRKNDGQVREINTSQLRRGNNLKKQINNYIGKSMFSFAQNHQSCRLGRPLHIAVNHVNHAL